MTYSDFTLSLAISKFGLTLDMDTDLFSTVPPLPPGELLQQTLQYNAPLAIAISTEKARSELLIAPVLMELRRQRGGKVNLFSGNLFSVDISVGLSGFCDFLLTHSPYQSEIQAPVVAIVEAKKEDVTNGYGQCVATMVAAQQFNSREHEPIEIIYGVVTTGDIWKFLSLKGTDVKVDRDTYYLDRIERILGVLWHVTE
ncbi:MAG: hypothetical protein H8F28_09975 [Fibrella sp.]|nr:hypothetical protein [Armatimonadota bacterium]